ncbi:helix-turn-helix domain-containing protein [Lederbergia sp. NSJ-179]|uniref:PucR family transcriptional regulator n=1 Tax=Lederbergia sp. NSJ-179 TaxID=2931402 RepID=UPI001FD2D848|nr:helix-turn-helix domain-containing protein [Lederbergia sp. NSJ-179]MCJ7840434.1 helix-turn-helix domain-containing protein [Lederbergia sp. NSJ-179]
MINRLLQLYPEAITSPEPNTNSNYMWLKDDEDGESYIGIPLSNLTKEEMILLSNLFPLSAKKVYLDRTPLAEEWYHFLIHNGKVPHSKSQNIRFVHFAIPNVRDDFQYNEWEEATKSLFSTDVIFVPFSHHRGVIIEEKPNLSITEEELSSAIEALESDFFIKIHFYLGFFQPIDDHLKSRFQLEQKLLTVSLADHPEDRIITREKVIPNYLYLNLPDQERSILFADIHRVLIDDPELTKTIKTYIENQSNATFTAKQLFMHRNSLQYRIDKFIEKTGVDIKTFHGAFFTYLACLHVDGLQE